MIDFLFLSKVFDNPFSLLEESEEADAGIASF
jgi:hypothetical protein